MQEREYLCRAILPDGELSGGKRCLCERINDDRDSLSVWPPRFKAYHWANLHLIMVHFVYTVTHRRASAPVTVGGALLAEYRRSHGREASRRARRVVGVQPTYRTAKRIPLPPAGAIIETHF